jgi:hypothetical protein
MLLLGPMDRNITTDPAIGIVQRTKAGTAGICRARVNGTADQLRFIADPKPQDTVAATGVVAVRRPAGGEDPDQGAAAACLPRGHRERGERANRLPRRGPAALGRHPPGPGAR